MSTYYAPKLPLNIENSNFEMLNDVLPALKQQLKMIILTNPGEKIYNPDFGVGIYKYIFEPNAGIIRVTSGTNKTIEIEDFEEIISGKIVEQVSKYAPDIYISNISVEQKDQTLIIELEYNYKNYISDTLQIAIGT